MKQLLAMVGACAWVSAAGAAPAVVGNDACPYYAVDIEAFATCDESGVAVPEDVPLAVEALLSEDSVPDARRTFEALYVNARRATYDAIVMLICRSGDRGAHAADELSRRGDLPVVTIVDGYDGELGPGGHRSLDGWKNASQPWTARVNTDLISAER